MGVAFGMVLHTAREVSNGERPHSGVACAPVRLHFIIEGTEA